MIKYIIGFLLFLISVTIGYTKNLSKGDIVGLWHLVDFIIIDKNNKSTQWGEKVHGTLLYTIDNFMSVSINGWHNQEPLYLFYSGAYNINKNNIIMHHVKNASDVNRINQILERKAHLKGNLLTLTAHGEYGRATLIWKK